MGIVILLLLVAAVVGVASYLIAFLLELDGDKEYLIKDGLIKELLEKHSNQNIDISCDRYRTNIKIERIEIRSNVGNWWFPYKVEKLALPITERITKGDWGETVGYITRFSKDYFYIKSLTKIEKKDKLQTQRHKLGL